MHKIILPFISAEQRRDDSILKRYCQLYCLYALQLYTKYDVEVVRDTGNKIKSIKHYAEFPKHTGQPETIFLFDEKPFLTSHDDNVYIVGNRWIDQLVEIGFGGIFLGQRRRSTEHLFDNKIPVFSLPGFGANPLLDCEGHIWHSISLNAEKNISVFFGGNFRTDGRRRGEERSKAAQRLRKIPNTQIHDNCKQWSTYAEYLSLMCKSKIAWCPRSISGFPDTNCNGYTGRELEACCLEVMVLRPPLGNIETEQRIPGVHFVEVRNDLSDLLDKTLYYLEHEEERLNIAREGRLWYERNISPLARAHSMYDSCLSALQRKS